MRIATGLFALLAVAGIASADDAGWIMDEYDKGVAAAKKRNVLMQVDWTAEWCGWCKKLEKDTYAKPEVQKFIMANFVNVRMDKDKNGELAEKQGIGGIPALLFIDPEGRVIGRIVGYRGPEDYLKEVKDIQGNFQKLSAAEKKLEKEASDLEARLAIAEVWAAVENWAEVEPHLNAVMDGDKGNAKGLAAGVWFVKAKAGLAKNDAAAVKEAAAKVRELDPENKKGNHAAVGVLEGRSMMESDSKTAKEVLQKVVADHPKSDAAPEAMFYVGVILADVEKNWDAAVGHFKKLAATYPESGQAKRVPQILKNIENIRKKNAK